MAIDAERLIINLSADFKRFERDMRSAAGISDRQFRAIERRAQQAQDRIKGFGVGIGRSIGAFAAVTLGVQGVRDIANYASAYRDLQNALKVTGLEGAGLKEVFGQLSRIALDQGAPLDALVTLYSRASQASKELNATQGELIQFSDGIATALRVAGTSATQAQGALLQLSQALGGGIVRAEEFNSINEGARPILQAVAAGLKEAGGSVSKLRALVLDGAVSSEAFFRAFLAGSAGLREQAGKTDATVSQSFSRIGTALTLLIGHLDDTYGASDNAAAGLDRVAKVIEGLPGYIDAAVAGLDSLEQYLNKLGNSDVFTKLNDFLKIDPRAAAAAVGIPYQPKNTVPYGSSLLGAAGVPAPGSSSSTPAGSTTGGIGSDLVAAADGSKDLAASADQATVSLDDFAVAADGAKDKNSFPTGGAISNYVNDVVQAEYGNGKVYKNPDSTASGAGQFIESTWLRLFKENFPDRAKGMADGAILALRRDAEISKSLIQAYAEENANVLRGAGIAVNEAALHLSHFLGAGDAKKVLSAAPGTPLAGLISAASIKANPTILGGGRTVDDARAYAEKRAGNTRVAAGNLTPAEEAAKDRVKDYQDLVAGSVEFIAAQEAEAAAVGKTALQAAKLRYEQQLLNEASAAGLEITPQLKEQISQLATGMAQAEVAANNLADAQQLSAEQLEEFKDFGKDAVKGLVSDLIAGKSAGEAFAGVLQKIGDKLIDMAIDGLFEKAFAGAGGGGGLGGLLGGIGKIFGFASGGYTGAGGKYQPAGIVHKGEYVVPKGVVDKVGVRNIQRLMGGYAEGGLVGGVSLRAPSAQSMSKQRAAGPQSMSIAVDVTGANGDRQIEDLVRQGVAAGIGQYDKTLDRTIGGKLSKSQARTL
ncbi:tape measure protein [Aureimonas glaciei]|uniref:Tape measure protein N-terminal domain-containing protein n=1 Tax=Aureimonas glaciei TaxID=1776957 RepID=A0A917DEN5_9HYPH|nr:tape measure protein [Aureimonas glaciei]GGD30717.1 hypothetical protein GCM10011335_37210 [Aureimonas glaciei]